MDAGRARRRSPITSDLMVYFKNWPVRAKLKLVILSTTFLSVAMVFAALFVYEYVTYDRILLDDLSAKASLLGENMDAALAAGDSADASRVLQSLASQQRIVSASVYNTAGRLFASYSRPGAEEEPHR